MGTHVTCLHTRLPGLQNLMRPCSQSTDSSNEKTKPNKNSHPDTLTLLDCLQRAQDNFYAQGVHLETGYLTAFGIRCQVH